MKKIKDIGDNNYLDNRVVFKDICIAYYTSNKTLNLKYTTPNFDDVNIIGDKFTLKNGKIYINEGVKKVKINAIVFLEKINRANVGYIWGFIQKNGVDVSTAICVSAGDYHSLTFSDIIVDVKEEDYFSVIFNNPNYDTHAVTIRSGISNSRLYIEVIE